MAGELVTMSDQFQGLPMDTLIGGPLTAACDSQLKLARATADFIKVIGFDTKFKEDGTIESQKTRTASFKFNRPVELPNKKEKDGSLTTIIGEQEVELEVPLLALVNVPNLSIKTVDITFDMEVKSSFETKSSVDAEAALQAEAFIGYGPFSAKVSVQGKVSSHKESTRKSDNSAKYHVSVHASDEGMPEGLARVMDILQTSVAPKAIGEAKPLNPPTE
nr:DUF2589 domain-containing protein [uncultured Desulfobacter sp.]